MAFTPSMGIDQNQDGKFIDRYFGRVPKFIHMIPEQGICEVNQDYLTLIHGVINGTIPQDNIEEELYREVLDFIDKMCNPCNLNGIDQALLRAFDGHNPCPEPSIYMQCDDYICCNEVLSCNDVDPNTCPAPGPHSTNP